MRKRTSLRAMAWLILTAGLASSAGCAGPYAFRDDPLYGDAPPIASASAPYRGPAKQPSETARLGRNSTGLAIDSQPRPGLDRVEDRHSPALVPVGYTHSGQHDSSWEQAREMLRARGVSWQQLEMREGLWHFRCSVPNPQNPTLSRHYEASAADELSAIRAVLDRIDSESPLGRDSGSRG